MYYCKEFADKLNDSFLKKYIEGTLLRPGEIFKFENLNNVFDIEILSFDGKYIEFIIENHTETWTIDNFYIFDNIHLEKLFDNAKIYKYDINSPVLNWKGVSGVYILHDEEENKYYVGQSKNINSRLLEHSHGNSSLIDKRLHETNNFTLRCIKLKGSGYSNLNALESAFIAYLKSKFNGYNKTAGNKTAPKKATSSDIDKKVTII